MNARKLDVDQPIRHQKSGGRYRNQLAKGCALRVNLPHPSFPPTHLIVNRATLASVHSSLAPWLPPGMQIIVGLAALGGISSLAPTARNYPWLIMPNCTVHSMNYHRFIILKRSQLTARRYSFLLSTRCRTADRKRFSLRSLFRVQPP